MNLTFQTPWLLYCIWIVPALAALWLAMHRRARRALDAFIPPAMQAKLLPARGQARPVWQTWLAALGSMFLLLASAGPRWGEREETVLQQSRDLIIAIDVSQSMLANDIHPSRLERAKVDAMDLIASLQGDRAALLAFRAKPALVCPLTTDYAFLRQALAGITTGSAPRGETDIGTAIGRALDAFSETDASHKAVILISDGEDLSGLALEMAEKAGSRGIPIYTVGLGSRAGSTIPDPQNPGNVIRHEGEAVITKLNHEALYTIAQKSGGSYIPIETAGMAETTLGTIYSDHLRSVTRRELSETRRRRAVERYQWFLLPAFLLLAAACTLSRGRLAAGPRTPPATAAQTLASLLLLLSVAIPTEALAKTPLQEPAREDARPPVVSNAPVSLMEGERPREPARGDATGVTNDAAQAARPEAASSPALPEKFAKLTGHHAARQAQKAYRQGDYETAAALYRRAVTDSSPRTLQAYRYNEAAALAAAGRHSEAADLFRSLSLQPDRRGGIDAAPALGATLYQLAASTNAATAAGAAARHDALRQAGEAFKEALRNQPEADAVRHDLALTLKQLPEADEQAKALRLAEQYAKTQASALAAEMLATQRGIAAAIASAATNRAPERIAAFESLATRQQENADRWLPLKQKLAEALAQQQQPQDDQTQQALAAMFSLMDVTQQNMTDSFHQLRDIEPDAFRPAKLAEQGNYQLWKAVAPHELLLGEDITQQTNAIAQVAGQQPPDPTLSTAELQSESAELTDLFRARFEQAVPPEGNLQPPAEDAGEDAKPQGISPEVRAQIVVLATETAGIQRDAAALIKDGKLDEAMAAQLTARDKLLEIAELLPKPPPQQQQQDEPQEQPPPQPDQQQQQEQQDENQKDEPQPEQKPEPDNQPESDVQKILQRALEREREFEEEKRKRQNRIPLPPSARDW